MSAPISNAYFLAEKSTINDELTKIIGCARVSQNIVVERSISQNNGCRK